MVNEFEDLRDRLRHFAAERSWGSAHSVRNLALALTGEVGELVAELQWVHDADIPQHLADPSAKARVGDEAADVLIYLVQFADACGLDLLACARAKIEQNATRYPSAPMPAPACVDAQAPSAG
jgi:NTP pyrophosphatase (non-canonical NTP hydrolase)